MKKIGYRLLISLLMTAMILSCKSTYEKQGDKHLEEKRPLLALQRYSLVEQKGNGSEEFNSNYTKAYIMAMEQKGLEDPLADFAQNYSETILSLLRKSPSPENEKTFSLALLKLGEAAIGSETPRGIDVGFHFLMTADSLPNKAPEVNTRGTALRAQRAEASLKDIREQYDAAKAGDEYAGIIADYHMTFLSLLGPLNEEAKELWSKIRELNLSTYLMYDNQEVEQALGEVDRRINKYGVLLALTKYNPGKSSVYMEVKGFNGSTNPVPWKSEAFTLETEDGNHYQAASSRGFKTSDAIEISRESGLVGLTFNIPAGAKPAKLVYDYGVSISEKFLP